MIGKHTVKNFCSEDISLIKNYYEAINDTTQIWHCHHLNEDKFSRKELIKLGLYYDRPASELIFLTKAQHTCIHNSIKFKGKESAFTGKHHSDESKLKLSNALKGRKLSEATKQKMSNTRKGLLKGHIVSEETKQKISNTLKGHIPWNKGKHQIAWNKGKKGVSEETRLKMQLSARNRHKKIKESVELF